MTNQEKTRQLAEIIDRTVLPLITSDYVLWGLPYYINPGDTFIWNGALEMLKGCKYKCIGTCGWADYKYIPIKKDTVILIIGGGFFGDVWRKAWDNVMNTITLYPDNPIVILPQSIYYESQDIADSDAHRLAQLKKLTICVRDQRSFDYGCTQFSNPVVLVPDLAFHMDIKKIKSYMVDETDKILYLKRHDKEFPLGKTDITGCQVETKDWPAMTPGNRLSLPMKCTNKIISFADKILLPKTNKMFYTWIMKHVHRNIITKESVAFISQYKTIYTTRLHVMILAFLLDKKVFIMDNSYGKVSGCYQTWLNGCDNIEIY